MKLKSSIIKTLGALMFLCFVNLACAQKGAIDKTELDFLSNYLTVSLEDTQKTLEDVDEKLWSYKPKSGGWSIGECMEHIMLAETALFKQVKGALEQEADNNKDLSYQDGYVITKAVDRGKKAVTPLVPQSVSKSKNEYLSSLESTRKEIISYISEKGLPLRNHFGRSPFGQVDTYQLVLIIAGHGMRHTAQIREVIEEYKGANAD